MRVIYHALLAAWIGHAKDQQKNCILIKRDLNNEKRYQMLLQKSHFQAVAVGVEYVLLWVIKPGNKIEGDNFTHWIASDITCDCFALRSQKLVSDKHICDVKISDEIKYRRILEAANIDSTMTLKLNQSSGGEILPVSRPNIIKFLRSIYPSTNKITAIECIRVTSIQDFRTSMGRNNRGRLYNIFDRISKLDDETYILVNRIGKPSTAPGIVSLEECNYSDDDESKSRMNLHSDMSILYTFAKFRILPDTKYPACYLIKRDFGLPVPGFYASTIDIAEVADGVLVLTTAHLRKSTVRSSSIKHMAQWVCEEASALVGTIGTNSTLGYSLTSNTPLKCVRIEEKDAYRCKRCIGNVVNLKTVIWGGTGFANAYEVCMSDFKKIDCHRVCTINEVVTNVGPFKIFLAAEKWNEILKSTPDLPYALSNTQEQISVKRKREASDILKAR